MSQFIQLLACHRPHPRSSRYGRMGMFCLGLLAVPALSDDKITYQEHILPLVEANCSKCHNADKKKADLELTSYQGALKGSGSGPVVVSGNLDGSKIWKALNHTEEPFMPPNRPKLDDKEIEKFKKWIVGGLLENATGKAVPAVAPGVDLSLKADAIGKPEGPPPMPKELPLEPVVHTDHTNAITGLASSPWAPLIAVAGQKQVLLFGSTLASDASATNGTSTNSTPPVQSNKDGKNQITNSLRAEASYSLLGILPFTEGQPVELKFSRNGKLLLAAGGRGAKSGRVVVWDITSGERLMTLGDEYDTILTADIRPDQSQVAVGGPSRLVKLISTKNGEIQHKLKKHTDWVTAIAFSPNGEMLATADRNGGISIWDPDNAQELFTLAGHKSFVTALSWRGDSKLLASSSEDGSVHVWEMKEGKQVKNWNAHASGAFCVSYSHDGRFVTCGRDNTIIIWDANGGKVHALKAPAELPLRAVFTHDGKQVVATDFSGHVSLWNSADGKPIAELNPNPLPIEPQLAAAKKRLTKLQAANGKSEEPDLTVAESEAVVNRLEAAQLISSAYALRESLAVKKREQEQAPLAETKDNSKPTPTKLAADIKADQARLDELLQRYHSLISKR